MKIRADQIKVALGKKHADDFFMTEVKDGPTQYGSHFRLDALAFKKSWANPAIIGYEVKVSRSDFQRDDKWPAYLAMCNQFSFVCPKGLIDPDELPPEVGLIYYNPEKDTLYTRRKAMHRLIDEPVDMYKYIMMSKMDNDRHPFFSDKREYFEELVRDKNARQRLGKYVSQVISEELESLRSQVNELQYQVSDLERDQSIGTEVIQILKECGLRFSYGWRDRLRSRLVAGASDDIKIEVDRIRWALERLEEKMKPQEVAQ